MEVLVQKTGCEKVEASLLGRVAVLLSFHKESLFNKYRYFFPFWG